MAEDTQAIKGGAATTEQQVPADQSNAGKQTNQTQDDNSQSGNTGSSDGDNGSDQNGADTRQRPARADRRIGALHSELADALGKAEQAETENARLKAMLEQPIGDRVKMPDYSNVEQVTPEQLKQDIINTADQIVKLRLEEGLKQNAQNLTQKQANDRVLSDIETVITAHPELDPSNDETYDEDLEKYLVGSFQRAYKGDNSYRLKAHVDEYFRQNKGQRQTNNTNTNEDRSKAAVRGNAPRTSTGGKSVEDMSADEYLSYIRRK